jgi:superfamily II DNA/RNA helicase
MTDEFELLRKALSGQSHLPAGSTFAEACNRRLIGALSRGAASPPGEGDLAALTRHVLRREQERQGGISPMLPVPRVAPWPAAAAWHDYGVNVASESPGYLHLTARPWAPDWLADAVSHPVDGPATAEELRRDYGEWLAGDPFLHPFEAWRSYRCAGQREAVRGLLMAPPGSTLVVNLPTGAGKSLCPYIPTLTDPNGITVVVVPTTALAIDQERALATFIPHPTAYYSGGEGAVDDRNRGIRDRIRQGSQRIVFTSPEGVVQSLAGALYTASTRGSLRLLAVDEAHIIDQWGDDFRPEFQELSGLRRDLLRQCAGAPFKTVLLTGTMTEPCLDTLETLFGKPGPFDVLSAVQIRPEPSYWLAGCESESIRQDRVLEALRHLPRPLILYVTRVSDAQAWLVRLQAAGFRRLRAVTGATRPLERAEVVHGWQHGDLDLVVATSAFGLGMDKSDIRAVIHACIPEHIDRFYQEVGRGGRDGRASVSLLLHTPEDAQVARDLNQKTIITPEKGSARWRAMFYAGETLPDGRSRVPVDVVPEYGFGEFSSNARNLAWNVHTLALLARCEVIDLDAQPPPRPDDFLSDDGVLDEQRFQAEFTRHRNQRVVRIIDEAHLEFEATWRGAVERSRGKDARSTRHGLDLMFEALASGRCLADILAEAYEIPLRSGERPRPASLVSRGCGGCPTCRRRGLPPRAGAMPTPRPAWLGLPAALPPDLLSLLSPAGQAVLFDDLLGRATGSDRQRRERLVRWLAAKGIRSFVAPAEELDRLRPLFPMPPGPPVLFDEEWKPLHLPPVPALIIHPAEPVLATILRSVERATRTELPRLLWLPADTRDPEKPHCLLRHTVRLASYTIDEFCTRVGV